MTTACLQCALLATLLGGASGGASGGAQDMTASDAAAAEPLDHWQPGYLPRVEYDDEYDAAETRRPATAVITIEAIKDPSLSADDPDAADD